MNVAPLPAPLRYSRHAKVRIQSNINELDPEIKYEFRVEHHWELGNKRYLGDTKRNTQEGPTGKQVPGAQHPVRPREKTQNAPHSWATTVNDKSLSHQPIAVVIFAFPLG